MNESDQIRPNDIWFSENGVKVRVVRIEANRIFYVYVTSGYKSSMDRNSFLGYFEK